MLAYLLRGCMIVSAAGNDLLVSLIVDLPGPFLQRQVVLQNERDQLMDQSNHIFICKFLTSTTVGCVLVPEHGCLKVGLRIYRVGT